MDSSPTAGSSYDTPKGPDMSQQWKIFMALVPHLPLMARVVVAHTLRLSEQSKYLDLRSELLVTVLRELINPPTPLPISRTQKLTLRDPGVKGRIWVSRYVSPVPPETDSLDALLSAVEKLRDPAAPQAELRRPDIKPVEAEWTGYRAAATGDSRLPPISERERFDEMQKGVTSPTTVLYLHGGAYYLLDPAIYRPLSKKLAKLTGGRCYVVRYRLAPQNPFPAAVLDALVSYMTLLYPPPDAYHEPVKPEHIVFAGDSAGGNLCLALTQTILELRRQGRKIAWFGEERDLPLPAGVGVSSPWMDIVQSSDSWTRNAKFDYLPGRDAQRSTVFPACDVWPATPPRGQIYVDDAHLAHPLATLLMAQDWGGAPPTYICTGWELLADEDKFMAKRLQSQGAKVVLEEYEGMPHCFAILLPDTSAGRRCVDGWAGFLKEAVEGPDTLESRAFTVKAKTLKEVEMPFSGLSELTDEEIRSRVLSHVETARTQPEAMAKL